MTERDCAMLPLTDTYMATENSQGASLPIMSFWRTVTGLNFIGQIIQDKEQGQVFVTANLDESGMPSVFFGRLKIVGEAISELELYIDRSRADSGFVLLPEEMNKHPRGWTSPIPADGKATRAELEAVARAIFDNSDGVEYQADPDCILMELGGVVYEDPEYLDNLCSDESTRSESRPKELVTVPAGLWPMRPTDPNARIIAIDEEQGVVVASALIDGFVCPYVVPGETASCFVPACMIENHRNTVDLEKLKDKKVIAEIPASAVTMEILRFHSGKVQGMHRYINLQGPGAGTPWVTK
jgi:hypothetical protein